NTESLAEEAERTGDDLSRWAVAREAAGALELRLDETGDATTRRHSAALVERIRLGTDAAFADQELLNSTLSIRTEWSEDPLREKDDRLSEAFRKRGVRPDQMTPEAAASVIAGRPARVALAIAASLDAWAQIRRESDD